VTKKQNFYPLDGYPITNMFSNIKDIKEYLNGEKITCLLCGRTYKALSTHIYLAHQRSIDSYKEQYGLPYWQGLTSISTKAKNVASGLKTNNLSRIKNREEQREKAIQAPRRSSFAHKLSSKENVKKAPPCLPKFDDENGLEILKYMVTFNCSLNNAIDNTGIMGRTAFINLLHRSDILKDHYAEARKLISKGKTNPITNQPLIMQDIKIMKQNGIPIAKIAEKYGLHHEYAGFLSRK
jgi:hypothetical protein